MKFKNKIIVVCLCVSVFAGGCGQGGQNTTKSKNSEGTASSKESTEQTSQDNEACSCSKDNRRNRLWYASFRKYLVRYETRMEYRIYKSSTWLPDIIWTLQIYDGQDH